MDKGNDGGLDEGGGHGTGGQGKRKTELEVKGTRKKEGIPGALGIRIGCRI